MELQKLTIDVEEGDEITALFNPNQITVQKTVNWQNAPARGRSSVESQHTHGNPATLTVALFFDTYESGEDVYRQHTQSIFNLTENIGELHRPPICTLRWGIWQIFRGVLQQINQQYNLFLPDGTPVRATCTCTFKEWRSAQEESATSNPQSSDVTKTHTVVRGETVSQIAASEYDDPALWRPIAESNNLDNPRKLTAGQVLIIPALKT